MSINKKIILLLGIVFSFSLNLKADVLTIKCNNVSETIDIKEIDYIPGLEDQAYSTGTIYPIYKTGDCMFFEYGDNCNNTMVEQSLQFSINKGVQTQAHINNPGYYTVSIYWDEDTYDPTIIKVVLKEHQHNMSGTVVNSTCNTLGKPVQCSICNRWFFDNEGTVENECASTDTRPVLGHDFTDQTWTTDEVNGGKYRICTRTGCGHKQYSYDVVTGEPALGIKLEDGETLTYPQSKSPVYSPVYADNSTLWEMKLGETTACELTSSQIAGVVTQWQHSSSADHQCADKSWADGCTVEGCAEGRTKRWIVVNENSVETTATTGDLVIESLTLDDVNGYECEAEYTAKAASYARTMSNEWGTLCLPFEIKYNATSQDKIYQLSEVKSTEIVLTEITENIPAGTPVLVRLNAESEGFTLSESNVAVTNVPAVGSSADGLSLVGRFTASDALAGDNYVIGNGKFWRVSDLTSTDNITDVKVGAFRAYLQSNGALQAAKQMSLSIDGDDTTGIVETLNDMTNGEAECYDLSGKRLTGLQRGVNIVKRNGKTMKVIIR